MTLSVPVNVWTIGAVLTVTAVWWFYRLERDSGDWDFSMLPLLPIVFVIAFWFTVILSKVLR